jgi:hypothetical protein
LHISAVEKPQNNLFTEETTMATIYKTTKSTTAYPVAVAGTGGITLASGVQLESPSATPPAGKKVSGTYRFDDYKSGSSWTGEQIEVPTGAVAKA